MDTYRYVVVGKSGLVAEDRHSILKRPLPGPEDRWMPVPHIDTGVSTPNGRFIVALTSSRGIVLDSLRVTRLKYKYSKGIPFSFQELQNLIETPPEDGLWPDWTPSAEVLETRHEKIVMLKKAALIAEGAGLGFFVGGIGAGPGAAVGYTFGEVLDLFGLL